MWPEQVKQLITSISALPSITKKQAEKLAYNLLTSHQNEASKFFATYKAAVRAVSQCTECGNLATTKICQICQNPTGDRQSMLIIVESPLDIVKFEKTEVIKGFYHVLNGLIDVHNQDHHDNLNVAKLPERARKFKEVIIALSSNIEGIVTANYIKSLLGDQKITQLAQGIPLGSAMEYVDQLTLKSALKNRKEIK